jgi:signal transduction histidine kinase
MAAAQRIANLVRLVEEAPAEWRDRIISGASEPSFRTSIVAKEPPMAPDATAAGPAAQTIASFLTDELSAVPTRQVRVRIKIPVISMHGPGMGPNMGPGFGYGPMRHWMGSARGLEAAVQLNDARWLVVTTLLPDTGPALSPRLILAIAVMAGIVGLVAAFAVKRLTAPLAMLASAAARIGRDVNAPPLVASGSAEVRQAAQALNEMQSRLRQMIEGRTNMLAAISHDLRTELQLLRLRVEGLEPPDEREKLLGTIGGMEDMLAATLAFAREEVVTEPVHVTEIGALVASIADDLADAGLPVAFEAPTEPLIVQCQPRALARALKNLIDNAIKYGSCARVGLHATADAIEITVDDQGPGIPEPELERVLQPFYRLEASRSRETGGMGLGLAIARSIADANGYSLRLANLPQRGLRATLTLPRPHSSSEHAYPVNSGDGGWH